jgi:hypothetical protein
LRPLKKKGFEGKKKEVDHVEGRKNPFQNTTLHPLHPKSPTSISTLFLLPENLSLKPNNKESRNNYLHYRCP